MIGLLDLHLSIRDIRIDVVDLSPQPVQLGNRSACGFVDSLTPARAVGLLAQSGTAALGGVVCKKHLNSTSFGFIATNYRRDGGANTCRGMAST